jgi:hypothetical protein
MSELVEIKKIVIVIGDNEVELSLEQAKSLRDELNKIVPTERMGYIYYPTTYPNPTITYPTPTITWCSSGWCCDSSTGKITITPADEPKG